MQNKQEQIKNIADSYNKMTKLVNKYIKNMIPYDVNLEYAYSQKIAEPQIIFCKNGSIKITIWCMDQFETRFSLTRTIANGDILLESPKKQIGAIMFSI